MTPSRGRLLVQPVETQEQSGGIFLLEETRARWVGQQCEVVSVGEPERCDEWEDCSRPHDTMMHHPITVKSGDWILVTPRSYAATDVDKRWVIRQDDVLARLTLTNG